MVAAQILSPQSNALVDGVAKGQVGRVSAPPVSSPIPAAFSNPQGQVKPKEFDLARALEQKAPEKPHGVLTGVETWGTRAFLYQFMGPMIFGALATGVAWSMRQVGKLPGLDGVANAAEKIAPFKDKLLVPATFLAESNLVAQKVGDKAVSNLFSRGVDRVATMVRGTSSQPVSAAVVEPMSVAGKNSVETMSVAGKNAMAETMSVAQKNAAALNTDIGRTVAKFEQQAGKGLGTAIRTVSVGVGSVLGKVDKVIGRTGWTPTISMKNLGTKRAVAKLAAAEPYLDKAAAAFRADVYDLRFNTEVSAAVHNIETGFTQLSELSKAAKSNIGHISHDAIKDNLKLVKDGLEALQKHEGGNAVTKIFSPTGSATFSKNFANFEKRLTGAASWLGRSAAVGDLKETFAHLPQTIGKSNTGKTLLVGSVLAGIGAALVHAHHKHKEAKTQIHALEESLAGVVPVAGAVDVVAKAKHEAAKEAHGTALVESANAAANGLFMTTGMKMALPLIGAQMALPMIALKQASPLPQLFEAANDAFHRHEHLGPETYEMLLATADKRIGSVGQNNGLLHDVAAQLAAKQVSPVEVMRKLETGQIDFMATATAAKRAMEGYKPGAKVVAANENAVGGAIVGEAKGRLEKTHPTAKAATSAAEYFKPGNMVASASHLGDLAANHNFPVGSRRLGA